VSCAAHAALMLEVFWHWRLACLPQGRQHYEREGEKVSAKQQLFSKAGAGHCQLLQCAGCD
jgi:hypothetical protein